MCNIFKWLSENKEKIDKGITGVVGDKYFIDGREYPLEMEPTVYELIKAHPDFDGLVGQEYSNVGNIHYLLWHYPLSYKGTDMATSLKWGQKPIRSIIVISNPEYFKKVGGSKPVEEQPLLKDLR